MESIYPNLTTKMIENGLSYNDLAQVIHASEDVVSQKMKGLLSWTLVEAARICRYFHTSDIDFLFLQLDTNT